MFQRALRLSILLSLLAAEDGSFARPTRSGVMGSFKAAKSLYEAGKFDKAKGRFETILRRYPGHEPSLELYAKTLYRLNRLSDAQPVYARLNLDHIDPETQYEYGHSFLSVKKYDGALQAFRKVPDGHALADLASYYGAICAIKLQQYELADELLSAAVVLPDKLARNKPLYRKHIREMMTLQKRRELRHQRNLERRKMREERLRSLHQSKQDASKASQKTPAPEQKLVDRYQGYMLHPLRDDHRKVSPNGARLHYEKTTQTEEFSGAAERNSTIEEGSFFFRATPMTELPFPTGSRKAATGVRLQLGATDRKVNGVERRFVIEDDSSDILKTRTKKEDEVNVQMGEVLVMPWIEFPLGSSSSSPFWAAAFGEVYFLYPEFERGGREGSRLGGGHIGAKFAPVTLRAQTFYNELVDSETNPLSEQVRTAVLAEWELSGKFFLEAAIQHDQFTYLDDSIDGPDSSTGVFIGAMQKMPWGFRLSASGAYEFQSNAIYHGLETFDEIAADGHSFSGQLKLVGAPFPWLEAFGAISQSNTQWDVHLPETESVFLKQVPDSIQRLVFGAAARFNF